MFLALTLAFCTGDNCDPLSDSLSEGISPVAAIKAFLRSSHRFVEASRSIFFERPLLRLVTELSDGRYLLTELKVFFSLSTGSVLIFSMFVDFTFSGVFEGDLISVISFEESIFGRF